MLFQLCKLFNRTNFRYFYLFIFVIASCLLLRADPVTLSAPIYFLPGHVNKITQLQFSPDGNILASRSDDGTVIFWNSATCEFITLLTGDHCELNDIAFSPDGKTLATIANNCTVILWDVQSGLPRITLSGDEQLARAISFSADGKTLAVVPEEGAVTYWDTSTGKKRLFIKTSETPNGIAYSPNGKYFAIFSTSINVYAIDTGKMIFEIPEEKSGNMVFSPDNQLLIVTKDNAIACWNCVEEKEIWTTPEQGLVLGAITFTPDGKTMLAQGIDGSAAMVWDILTEQEIHPDYCKDVNMTSLAFHPNGKTVALGREGGSICLVDMATAAKQEMKCARRDKIAGILLSPDKKYLATRTEGDIIVVWDLTTGELQCAITAYKEIIDCRFQPNGHLLGILHPGEEGSIITTWDVDTGKVLADVAFDDTPTSFDYSPQDANIAMAIDALDVCYIDIHKTAKNLQSLSMKVNYISHLQFSPDGKLLAARASQSLGYGLKQQLLLIVDVATGKIMRTIEDGIANNAGMIFTFSPDSRQIAASSNLGEEITIWDIASGDKICVLSGGHTDPITCLAFSPDGKMIASAANSNNTIVLWELDGKKRMWAISDHRNTVTIVAFLSQTLFASGSSDGTTQLWDLAKKDEVLFPGIVMSDLLTTSTEPHMIGVSDKCHRATLISLNAGAYWLSYTPDSYFACSDDTYAILQAYKNTKLVSKNETLLPFRITNGTLLKRGN